LSTLKPCWQIECQKSAPNGTPWSPSRLVRKRPVAGSRRIPFHGERTQNGAQLSSQRVLRLNVRSKAGHFVKVHLPEEIRAVGAGESAAGAAQRMDSAGDLEKADFLEKRQAIHAREGRFCFYCLGRLRPRVR
jgi:hypothetical protein